MVSAVMVSVFPHNLGVSVLRHDSTKGHAEQDSA